jgi:hypothetical protein
MTFDLNPPPFFKNKKKYIFFKFIGRISVGQKRSQGLVLRGHVRRRLRRSRPDGNPQSLHRRVHRPLPNIERRSEMQFDFA